MNLKKNCLILSFLIYAVSFLFAKSSPKIPEWVLNYQKEFPDSKYIAQKGTGKKAEDSKNEAASNLSFYFETTVNSRRETNYKSLETEEKNRHKIKTEQETIRETQMTTSTVLNAVEFTEPWYNKKDKTWHCVAYVERKTVWEKYEPTLRASKDTFMAFYIKAQECSDYFGKIRYLGQARKLGEDFLDKISYAQFLSEPLTDSHYKNDLLIFSSLSSLQQEEKNKSSLFVEVSNDSGNLVYSALLKALTDSGFTVIKNKVEAAYAVNASVLFDSYKDGDLLVYSPSVQISIYGKDSSVYSYSKECKKIKAYTENVGERKSLEVISKVVEDAFYDDFNSALSGTK